MSKKEILFSVTAADCKFQFYRGSGAGGQKKNKTSSACRCTHKVSGAVGTAEDTRSQLQNKKLAFERMATSKKFKDWHKIEVSRKTGALKVMEDKVERELKTNVRVEGIDEDKWVVLKDSPKK